VLLIPLLVITGAVIMIVVVVATVVAALSLLISVRSLLIPLLAVAIGTGLGAVAGLAVVIRIVHLFITVFSFPDFGSPC
jgi:uncharacterized protein YebE (UPF0316 family)